MQQSVILFQDEFRVSKCAIGAQAQRGLNNHSRTKARVSLYRMASWEVSGPAEWKPCYFEPQGSSERTWNNKSEVSMKEKKCPTQAEIFLVGQADIRYIVQT